MAASLHICCCCRAQPMLTLFFREIFNRRAVTVFTRIVVATTIKLGEKFGATTIRGRLFIKYKSICAGESLKLSKWTRENWGKWCYILWIYEYIPISIQKIILNVWIIFMRFDKANRKNFPHHFKTSFIFPLFGPNLSPRLTNLISAIICVKFT